MKRFILFSGRDYYPEGGINDFRGDFDTLGEAADAAEVDAVTEIQRGWPPDWQDVFDQQDRVSYSRRKCPEWEPWGIYTGLQCE